MSQTLEALLKATAAEFDREGVELLGRDPVLPTRFRIAEAASAALGAVACGVRDFWALGSGASSDRLSARVEAGAAGAALLSFALQRLLGDADPLPARAERPTVAIYPAGDGRWVHLHGGFPSLREGTLEVLGCSDEASDVARAVRKWNAAELEDALADAGMCGAMVREAEEWDQHPQGRALEGVPPVEVIQIGESEPEPPAGGPRPLSGVRVLDLTRVLAGPTCARTLAEHGASVLKITAPHLPFVEPFVIDTGHGKRSAHLDLRDRHDAQRLRGLLRECDVFSQGYRAGAMERRGFGVNELAALRPGLIYVSINCYGHEGPWSDRPGWEQLAQSATGIAFENGSADGPRLLPAAATDYTTGYLAAYGVLLALGQRARRGGSYWVRASLSRTGMWLRGLGRTDAAAAQAARGLSLAELAPLLTTTGTAWGELQHLAPVLHMPGMPPRWQQPTVPLGHDEARWQ